MNTGWKKKKQKVQEVQKIQKRKGKMKNPHTGRNIQSNGQYAKRLMRNGTIPYSNDYADKVYNPETGRLISVNSQKAQKFLRNGFVLRTVNPQEVWFRNRRRSVKFNVDDILNYIQQQQNSNVKEELHRLYDVIDAFRIEMDFPPEGQQNIVRAMIHQDTIERKTRRNSALKNNIKISLRELS